MSLKELTEYCQALAIADKLSPDEASVWRSVCREYSKKFSTPLHEVINLDPEFVFLHCYEDQLEDLDNLEHLEKMIEIVQGIEDPDYDQTKRDQFDRFIEMAELQEQERIKLGKPIHPGIRKAQADQVALPDVDTGKALNDAPKSGHLNLSYLEKEETEGGLD
jgi:hypothetical protein